MYLSRGLPAAQLQAFLQAALPGLTAFSWAMLLGEQGPVEFDSRNAAHIFFEVLPAEVPQFPFHLAVYRTPSADEQTRALWLGQRLAAYGEVAVLVPFTHPAKPHADFYNIVFRGGVSYLADDSATEFGEPDAAPVRFLGEYGLPAAAFDAVGNLLKGRVTEKRPD